MHTKVYMFFGRKRIILPYINELIEILGVLSTDLKKRIIATKVAIIGKESAGLIAQAIGRMGFIIYNL